MTGAFMKAFDLGKARRTGSNVVGGSCPTTPRKPSTTSRSDEAGSSTGDSAYDSAGGSLPTSPRKAGGSLPTSPRKVAITELFASPKKLRSTVRSGVSVSAIQRRLNMGDTSGGAGPGAAPDPGHVAVAFALSGLALAATVPGATGGIGGVRLKTRDGKYEGPNQRLYCNNILVEQDAIDQNNL